MFQRFAEQPGLLYVAATLIPLASFFALLVVGGLKNIGRRYRDTGWGQSLYWLMGGDDPGKGGAYLATGAIGLSCVLSVVGLVRFLGEFPVASEHHEVQAAIHAPADAGHAPAPNHADSHEDKPAEWVGRVTLARMGRLIEDHRPATELQLGYRIDHLAAVMFAMVTFVATLIHIFALGYMNDETQVMVEDHQAHVTRRGRYERFFMWFSLFCFSMLNLILADNLFQVFVSWELVGACSFGLIGFYYERQSASDAANKAFITNRVGDVGFIIGMLIVWTYIGTFNFQDIFARLRPPAKDAHGEVVAAPYAAGKLTRVNLTNATAKVDPDGDHVLLLATGAHGHVHADDLKSEVTLDPTDMRDFHAIPYWLLTIAGLGVFLGCVGKSAQFPLQVWLPDAMEGPTPVSALVHSATMVAAGVYLVGRAFPLFTPEARMAIAYTGAITLFVAATIAVVANDIKKVLAYSTISQLGFMILALGVGGWVAGLLHLLTHAFFKALLFLCSGSVIYGCHHEQDMRKMGGLYYKMPITALTMLVGCLAIAGTPTFSGWYSKDAILAESLAFATVDPKHGILFLAPVITAGITTFYMFRMWFMTFTGPAKDHHVHDHAHESPWVMTIPLIVLACFSYFVAHGWPIWDAEASFLGRLLKMSEPSVVHADIGWIHDHAHHVYNYHALAGVLAVTSATIGFLFAAVLYWKRKLDPAEAAAQFPRVYRLLENKWYFDELYSALFVRPALTVAGWCKQFDITAIDRFIDGLARFVIRTARLSGRFDNNVVDGAVNVAGDSVFGLGHALRWVQTGHLRGYVLYLALGAVALFALATYFVNLAAAGH